MTIEYYLAMTPRRATPAFSASPSSPNSCEESLVSREAVPHFEVVLSNGRVALIDADMKHRVRNHTWRRVTSGFRATYAEAKIDGKSVRMHIHLFGKRDGLFIDHKNRNGLDNQGKNIRWATRSQNQMNIEKPRFRKGTSMFKGVDLCKSGTWRAKIRCNRVGYTLGRFKNEVDAAKAYDAAATRLFGEFANLNFQAVA